MCDMDEKCKVCGFTFGSHRGDSICRNQCPTGEGTMDWDMTHITIFEPERGCNDSEEMIDRFHNTKPELRWEIGVRNSLLPQLKCHTDAEGQNLLILRHPNSTAIKPTYLGVPIAIVNGEGFDLIAQIGGVDIIYPEPERGCNDQ